MSAHHASPPLSSPHLSSDRLSAARQLILINAGVGLPEAAREVAAELGMLQAQLREFAGRTLGLREPERLFLAGVAAHLGEIGAALERAERDAPAMLADMYDGCC